MERFRNYEYEQAILLRRTTLPSSNDANRMAIERTRARFNSHLSKAGPKEVGSSYRCTSKYFDAPCSINSQTKMQNLHNMSAIATFPTLVDDLLFCDRIDRESQTHFEDRRKFTCQCRNCTKPHCLAKILARKRSSFKDNIMTFHDRCTMTPTFVNATCGLSPCSSMVNDTNGMTCIAVRDTDCRTPVPDTSYSRPPTPILKRCSAQAYHDCAQNKMTCAVNDHVSETCQKPEKSGSLKYFFRLPKYLCRRHQSKECTSRTKNIYNEGISDELLCELPGCPGKTVQVTLPQEPKSYGSTSSDVRESCNSVMHIPVDIPHSHRYESKYHTNCKRAKDCDHYFVSARDGSRHRSVSPCPRMVRRCCHRRPIQPCGTPEIRLPKKVLTSERNIEAFIKKQHCHTKCRNI